MDSKIITTDEEIQYLSRQLLAKYREYLNKEGILASGKLATTAEQTISVQGKHVIIEWSLQDYWKYIEYGTPPHWPPLKAIEKWIKIKPIIPRAGKDGRIPSTKQLAYLISRKIVLEGTDARYAVYRTLKMEEDELIQKIADRVAELYDAEVTAILSKELF